MTKRVIILRGISGSGKSTVREEQYGNEAYVSSDDFFVNRLGVYEYVREDQGAAHNWCLREFLEYMSEGRAPCVVVDNTNIRASEIAPYYAVAECYGYEPEVVTLIVHPDTAIERNVHGLTEDMIMSQHERLISEELPRWWNCSTVDV